MKHIGYLVVGTTESGTFCTYLFQSKQEAEDFVIAIRNNPAVDATFECRPLAAFDSLTAAVNDMVEQFA